MPTYASDSDSDPNDIQFKPLLDRKPCKFELEVSVPTLELLRHERRMKHEDYKKLDKMKNVSLLLGAIDSNSFMVFSRR